MDRAHNENFSDSFQSLTPPRAGARNPFRPAVHATHRTHTKPAQSLSPSRLLKKRRMKGFSARQVIRTAQAWRAASVVGGRWPGSAAGRQLAIAGHHAGSVSSFGKRTRL